jgi:hypothetical protein
VYSVIVISEELASILVVGVVGTLTSAIALLYKDQRSIEKERREDLNRALTVMSEQSQVVSEFKTALDQLSVTIKTRNGTTS